MTHTADPHAANAVEAMHRAVELAQQVPTTASSPELCALAAVQLTTHALLPSGCAELDSASGRMLASGDPRTDLLTAAALLLLAAGPLA